MKLSPEESIKLEHSTLLEEYKSIKADIVHNLETARQIVNLTLTLAGILVAGAPFIIQYKVPSLFLVAPFIFYALAWIQLRCIYVEYHLTRYLVDILVPGLRRLLDESASASRGEADHANIMSWETYFLKTDRRQSLFVVAITHNASNSYGITLMAALLSVSAYLACVFASVQPVQIGDVILLVVNALLFLYSFILGLWTRTFLGRGTK
jgi:hypothetical protein